MSFCDKIIDTEAISGAGNTGILRWPIYPVVSLRLRVETDCGAGESVTFKGLFVFAADDTNETQFWTADLNNATQEASFILNRNNVSPLPDYFKFTWTSVVGAFTLDLWACIAVQ